MKTKIVYWDIVTSGKLLKDVVIGLVTSGSIVQNIVVVQWSTPSETNKSLYGKDYQNATQAFIFTLSTI